jgi:hypothetical protein
VRRITSDGDGLRVLADPDFSRRADLVLVSVGVQPNSSLAAAAGAALSIRGAVQVDTGMGDDLARRLGGRGLRPYTPPAAGAGGFNALTVASSAPDHKPYYPGAHELHMRWTGDRDSGLLGCQIAGHRDAQVAKRVDVPAAAIFAGLAVEQISDLDLSYTPPFGMPWDALQLGAQAWTAGLEPNAHPLSLPAVTSARGNRQHLRDEGITAARMTG